MRLSQLLTIGILIWNRTNVTLKVDDKCSRHSKALAEVYKQSYGVHSKQSMEYLEWKATSIASNLDACRNRK